MTYGQIRLRLAQLLPGIPSLDLIDGWIRDRYYEILDALKWQRLEKSDTIETVAETAVYALPEDCRILSSVSGDDGPLGGWQDWMDVAPETQGTPAAWKLTMDSETDPPRQQIRLYPVPNAVQTLDIRYTAEQTLTGGASVTLLPWVREGCLVAGVEADGLNHLKEFAAGDRKEARFLKLLGDMQRTETARRPVVALKTSRRFSAARWMQRPMRPRMNWTNE